MQRMSTDTIWSMQSASSGDTEAFGEQLGKRLKGHEVIELLSDLGGGKTTLTRGIARGAGSKDIVGSPTFTLSKVYRAEKCDIYHFDFYRLDEAGLMAFELHDALEDPRGVVIVEWGDVVKQVLPEERLTIRLAQTPEGGREIQCQCPKSMEYLKT
jgi:tRNA threonylcarbamoyladenosine biosynthesis protein TsaE